MAPIDYNANEERRLPIIVELRKAKQKPSGKQGCAQAKIDIATLVRLQYTTQHNIAATIAIIVPTFNLTV